MGTTEIHEVVLSAQDRAAARDAYVRAFERTFRDWLEIARCCVEVEADGDWEILGFGSFKQWLHDAAPASERYLYLVMGLYKGLIPDIPEETLQQIPLGTAEILQRQVKSPKLRRDPQVLEAAKQKPKKFTEAMREIAPDQHVDGAVRYNFSQGAADALDEGLATYMALTGELITLSQFVEFVVADWLDSDCPGTSYSNRQRAAQLTAGDRIRQQMERIG